MGTAAYRMTGVALAVVISMLSASALLGGQADPGAARVDSNVVFGRYSGLALLMDVYHPTTSKGRAVIYVPGSGFHTPLGYDARPITIYTRPLVPALVASGHTVFAVNHRAAPRFRHPAALEDIQRAARFVRSEAAALGIRADRLAAAGYSSGGTLASLLGVLGGEGDPNDPDPVNRLSARIQCVVAGGAAFDFTTLKSPMALPILGSYLGATLTLGYSQAGPEYRIYREASPITHVSADDAPHFIFHGDSDEVLPFDQADDMAAALRKAGVAVRLLRLPGAGHGKFTAAGAPDVLNETVQWLAGCLQGS